MGEGAYFAWRAADLREQASGCPDERLRARLLVQANDWVLRSEAAADGAANRVRTPTGAAAGERSG